MSTILRLPEPFDLVQTLSSGQVFRCWPAGDGRWFVCVRDRLFWLRQDGQRLEFAGANEGLVREFLDLDYDLAAALGRLGRIKPLRPAIEVCRGLRIVRHDPWECLVSFICSTRSNIPKIRRSLDVMAQCHGRLLRRDGMTVHAFPPPGSLCNLDLLRSAGVGYRAKYLLQTNRLCTNRMLRRIARMPYLQAREELKRFPGVGDKVADCVCLFSMRMREAFPVDVWVQRAMTELFPGCGRNAAEIRKSARETFGPDAGYAQQYLFQYRRLRGKG